MRDNSEGVDHPEYGRPDCPDCRSADTEIRTTRPWDHTTTPPVRIRYYRCGACDRHFKTVQTGHSQQT
jgi:transcriptional regulator NrdR family protein